MRDLSDHTHEQAVITPVTVILYSDGVITYDRLWLYCPKIFIRVKLKNKNNQTGYKSHSNGPKYLLALLPKLTLC